MRTQWWFVVSAAVALSLTGCEVVPLESAPPAATRDGGAGGGNGPVTGDPAKLLDGLTEAKAGSMKGYSRDKFPHWSSAGKNCDVRDSVLKRDGTSVKLSGCNVTGGRWKSSYDGRALTSPSTVDIDHVVPLANAWRSGASAWDDERRKDFANDLERPQLVAVSQTSNRAKGDQDPSTWKPKVKSTWCGYARDWIIVKSYWRLSVTTAEKRALTEMLKEC